MANGLEHAKQRVQSLRAQCQDRDCRGFWPDVVEWLCVHLETAWQRAEKAQQERDELRAALHAPDQQQCHTSSTELVRDSAA